LKPISFEVHPEGADGRFRLSGELDLAGADGLMQQVRPAIERGGDVTLDLSDLTFMDSSGIHAVVMIAKELDGKGSLVLHSPKGEVANVLALTGVDRLAPIHIIDPEDAAPLSKPT
jgi:anti-sigma B factor antagonist